MTYKIIRCYAKPYKQAKVMKRGLSLEQAQAHCQDPKTQKMTGLFHSQWFDAFERE